MKLSHNVFTRYGEDISLNGTQTKGFISPVNAKKYDNIKKPVAVGVKNGAEFLLLCPEEMAPCGGDIIIHKGRTFETLRAEAEYFCGEVSHYEAVMRPKGGDTDV